MLFAPYQTPYPVRLDKVWHCIRFSTKYEVINLLGDTEWRVQAFQDRCLGRLLLVLYRKHGLHTPHTRNAFLQQ